MSEKKEKRSAAEDNAIVDESSRESFPASDPPAWTGSTAHPVMEKSQKYKVRERPPDKE